MPTIERAKEDTSTKASNDRTGAKTKLGKASAKQSKKEKSKRQYYGGSENESKRLAERDKSEIRGSQAAEEEGLGGLRATRDAATDIAVDQSKSLGAEADDYRNKTSGTVAEGAAQRQGELGKANAYGLGSDQSLSDYRSGRDATLGGASALESNPWMKDYNAGRGGILGSASALEGYAQGAAGEYQSGADAAAKASAERAQRNALAVAAGRGANSVRTALAGANAANAQGALDQQVVRAQEANQLNAMRNDAVAQAAGIRTNVGGMDQQAAAQQAANTAQAAQIRAGVGAADQQAAQIQAQRQQAATGTATNLLGQQAAIQAQNAGYQMDAQTGQQAIAQNAQNVGLQTSGAILGAGQNYRDAYLGAQQAQNTSQLGVNQQTALQNAQSAKENSRTEKFKRGLGTATLGILGS